MQYEKTCPRCKQTKSIFTDFKVSKGKVAAYCIPCFVDYRREIYRRDPEAKKAAWRQWRLDNPQKVRARSRKYSLNRGAMMASKTPAELEAYKAKEKARQDRYRARNQDKIAARRAERKAESAQILAERKAVGKHILVVRKRLKWSQACMAEHLGTSLRNIIDWEIGVRIPRPCGAAKVKAALDLLLPPKKPALLTVRAEDLPRRKLVPAFS